MGKKSRREAHKSEEAREARRTPAAAEAGAAKGTLATAKDAVVRAAGQVAGAVTQAAGAVREHVVEPAAAAVGKPKKARFVRGKTAKRPAAKAAPLPPRSTKAAAKMMSKNLALPPKEERASGPKPRA
jgi:hypothetical protein